MPVGTGYCGGLEEGRMLEPEEIINILKMIYKICHYLVLITAGPTYESIDPIRFIANKVVVKWVLLWQNVQQNLG